MGMNTAHPAAHQTVSSLLGFVSDDASSSSSYMYIVVAMGRYDGAGSCFVTTFFDFIFTPQTPKNEKKEFVRCVSIIIGALLSSQKKTESGGRTVCI